VVIDFVATSRIGGGVGLLKTLMPYPSGVASPLVFGV